MLRMFVGFMLGWLAAQWYRSRHAAPTQYTTMPGGTGPTEMSDFESRAHTVLHETIRAARELGQEVQVASRMSTADVANKADRIREATETRPSEGMDRREP